MAEIHAVLLLNHGFDPSSFTLNSSEINILVVDHRFYSEGFKTVEHGPRFEQKRIQGKKEYTRSKGMDTKNSLEKGNFE
jgi:hypothetical protein